MLPGVSVVESDDEDEFSPFAKVHMTPAPVPPAPPLPSDDAAAPEFDPDAIVSGLHALSMHAEDGPVPLTPLDVFCSVLLAHNQGLFAEHSDPVVRMTRASQTIQAALERSHYDVSAAMQALRDAHMAGTDVASIETPTQSAMRVCRFFLAGECRRSDCRFSHDLNKALCRFWLRGHCLNDPCGFLHDYDALSKLAQSMVVAPAPPAPAPAPEPVVRPRLAASQSPWAMAAKSAPSSSAPVRMSRASTGPAVRAAPGQSARVPLRPPSLLPTLATGHVLAMDTGKIRAAQPKTQDAWATTQVLLRERHARISEQLKVAAGGDAGGWGSSAQASDEPGARGLRGRWIGGRLGLCLGVARRATAGPSLSLDERTEAMLDLHGLHVSEALDACEQFLLALPAEGFRGLCYLCVGAGKHSARSQGKLNAQVREFLASWGYPHAEYDGVIACDPCTHW
ncbi:hypothetical protein MCAP1_002588 [Malassezia caprae]|uniref:Uncharacterized protein n=1 Tax=Malassezia caprae TaxID=1381934 RepID=A0AAF0E8T5_9BASI|nr:hypothetical protein MCAP1_002588 [Malassezia caprae]